MLHPCLDPAEMLGVPFRGAYDAVRGDSREDTGIAIPYRYSRGDARVYANYDWCRVYLLHRVLCGGFDVYI